jgi:DNA (cytosine-5)-methyltransferase 1
VKLVDFFSGCGGTSAGFERAGADIVLGLDDDPIACSTFRRNFPRASIICKDIRDVRPRELEGHVQLSRDEVLVFSACAPCQPFSKQRREQRQHDDRATLLFSFLRFVRYWRPDYIFVENVPGVRSMSEERRSFGGFTRALTKLGYVVSVDTIDAYDYGVPQKRRRLVILASLHGPVSFPTKTHGLSAGKPYSTVREWIGHLPPIRAGESHPSIPNHRAAALSPLNLRRIMATPPGGSRKDWPRSLRLNCHANYDGHSDVYGRLREHMPASGLTTRCISLSNGRFGHPRQHRALSVREAARLQTFPDTFVFEGTLIQTARQVGNAVPVLLAERFANGILSHARAHARANRSKSK